MQHSELSYPVIHIIFCNGLPINIRRKGGGSVTNAAVALVESMLPQNSISFQVGNHAIANVDEELPTKADMYR